MYSICSYKGVTLNSFNQLLNGGDLIGLDLESRFKLCAIAREYASLPITDLYVPEAQTYSFKYPGEKEIRDDALLCPKLPEMYLRLVDPLKMKIKLTFIQNPYDHFIYRIEFFDYIYTQGKF